MTKLFLDQLDSLLFFQSSPGVYEAEIALRKCREIISQDGDRTDNKFVSEISIKEKDSGIKSTHWAIRLAQLCAFIFDCKLMNGTTASHFKFIGLENRHEMAVHAFTKLFGYILEARASYIKFLNKTYRLHEKRRLGDKFAFDWVSSVCEACSDIQSSKPMGSRSSPIDSVNGPEINMVRYGS